MLLEQDIRAFVTRYLAREVDREEFERLFVGGTWDVARSGDRRIVDLTFRIEGALAEMTSGYATEDDLRRELVGIFQDQWLASVELIDHQVERLTVKQAKLRFSAAGNEPAKALA
jgi:hypothetical protein